MPDRSDRWWDYPAMAFLFIALFASAVRLQTTNWIGELGRAQWLVLIGLPLGLLLGKSRFRPGIATLLGAVYSLFFVTWILASPMNAALWVDKLRNLFGRLAYASGELFGGRPVQDPWLILSIFCILYWLASLLAGYQLTRHGRPWVGLALAGLMVLIVDYSFEMYGAPDSGSALSLVYFLFSLILIARAYYLSASRGWRRNGGLVENEVSFDLGRTAVVVALGVVLLAWFSPRAVKAFTPGTQEAQQLSERFQDLRDRISNAVSSLNSQVPLFVESRGESMALGTSSSLSNEIVLMVRPDDGRLDNGRYYWSGRIYDTYVDGVWTATATRSTTFSQGERQASYNWAGRREVGVEISSLAAMLRTLYFPDTPLMTSRTVTAVLASEEGQPPDVTALISQPPVQAGEAYRVLASISFPTQDLLKGSAQGAYPSNVVARYTQLPLDFSPLVADLARTIAGDQATPYDQTVAVTNWLRDNITYQTAIIGAPSGVDPVEYFLIDLKQGFCNYYASAEVLMLRSLGIPARLNVGYAQGIWNAGTEAYEVAAKDSHAWPEVYFPGVGWVPFEPTSAQPPLDYPEITSASSSAAGAAPLGQPTPFIPELPASTGVDPSVLAAAEAAARAERLRLLVVQGVACIGGGMVVFFFLRWRKMTLRGRPLPTWFEETLVTRGMRPPHWLMRWSVRARRTPFEKLFGRVGEMLRVWGYTPEVNLTPAEQAARLSVVVPALAASSAILLAEYERATYSRLPGDLLLAQEAAHELRWRGYGLRVRRLLGFAF